MASVASDPSAWTKSARASWIARRKAASVPGRSMHDHRHDEPHEGEPRDGREHEEEREKGRRDEDDRADDDRAHHVLPARPNTADDCRGSGVGRSHQRRPRRENQDLEERVVADRDLVDDGDADSERQGRPEIVSVELQRLGHELPDRAGLGRKWWRQLALAHAEDATATSRGSSSPSAANASSNRHSARSGSPISFETTRTSTAGTPASSHARRTPKPSIASTSTSWVPPTRALVPIGSTRASGKAARRRESRSSVGERRADSTSGPVRVAVDRLGAEHERQRLEPARTGDPDVEDGGRPLLGERPRGRDRGVDRPDPADERLAPPRPARAPARSRPPPERPTPAK